MRWTWLALCLASVSLTSGCMSGQRKPFAANPLLLYYKPTLSDSATILAEQAARREPVAPPMPSFARENAIDFAPVVRQSDLDAIKPVRFEAPAAEARPVIRQSSEPSRPLEIHIQAQPPTVEIVPVEVKDVQSKSAMPASAEFVVTAEKIELQPLDLTRISFSPTANSSTEAPEPKRIDGDFGHEADYHWLQGVVQRHANGNCYIRYCDPSIEDEHGGKVRIANEASLAKFEDGDVVAIQGELLDAKNQAGQGAHYRVRQARLVRNRKSQPVVTSQLGL